MVKIEWSKESGFWVADKGLFINPNSWIDEGVLAGAFKMWVNGVKGILNVDILINRSFRKVRASEPGFDGLIKALNEHDWAKYSKEMAKAREEDRWRTSDELGHKWAWEKKADEAIDLGNIGTWMWYTRTASEIYGTSMPIWSIKREWRDVIDVPDRHYGPVTIVGNHLKRGYALEEAVSANGTATLWLNGYKRKAVVGMAMFDAIAALGVDVVVHEDIGSMWSSVRVAEGDNLAALAGDYDSFSDVSAALLLQRLCGSKLKISDLAKSQISSIRSDIMDVRFSKSLHSEVAANLDAAILSCKILKLKGLVEGKSLSEALCNAASVDHSDVMKALDGHKKKYLSHAIWSLKKEHRNDGLMPLFNATFGSTSIAKLPEDSLVNLYIGDLTGCCQHLAGAGKRVCKDGWKNSYNCNYVFRSESGGTVAHMWVWKDRNNNFVIDSVEARSYASMEEVAELIRAFGRYMATRGYKTLLSCDLAGRTKKVAEILDLKERITAGKQIQEKGWGYSDTDPGDECYVVY